MDSSNVALRPLLNHIATGLAISYVEQMEEIEVSPSETAEQEDGK